MSKERNGNQSSGGNGKRKKKETDKRRSNNRNVVPLGGGGGNGVGGSAEQTITEDSTKNASKQSEHIQKKMTEWIRLMKLPLFNSNIEKFQ